MLLSNSSKVIAALCLSASTVSTFAYDLKTDGGFEIYQSPDNHYWFSLHGIIKTDATFFIGDFDDKRDEFPSGAIVRSAEATVNGGVGKDFTYALTLSFESGTSVNDAYFTYHGFKNTEISFGQVISPFCLENANSGKAIPFLERSLPVIALRPCMGVGANFATWGDNTSFKIAVTTPLHGSNIDRAGIKHRSDRLTTTTRFVWAPYINDNCVTQIGVSGVYGNNYSTFRDGSFNADGRRFSTRPEAKARNTLAIINSGNALGINDYWELGVEAAQQWGPLLLEAEYLHALINRDFSEKVNFYGWHAQVAYVLTGESRHHKMKGASFGTIKPQCKYGAWEVAARYSMVDLNDKDIHGGKGHNVSASVGWYINEHLKILANYIHANIDPTRELGSANPNPGKRDLDIVAIRAQVAW